MFIKLYTESIVEIEEVEVADRHVSVGEILTKDGTEYIIFDISHSLVKEKINTTVHCCLGNTSDRLRVLTSNSWVAESTS